MTADHEVTPSLPATGASDLPLQGTRVLLGVSGGIAAYKAVLLARQLLTSGATVDPVLTRGAQRFVGTATFEGICGRPAHTEVWDDVAGDTHVAIGEAADIAVIYPATAHVLAKLAHGLADDLLTTTLLAAQCPVIVAPAMHTQMWQQPSTQDNVATLRAHGVHVIGPDDGPLMGGDTGPGRVVDPEDVFTAVVDVVARADAVTNDLAGRRVVVTAGGTREPLDPVRFLGNRSTGRMGFALAQAAARRGARVELVSAPTHLDTPPGVHRIDVTTAREMHQTVMALAGDGVDVIVKAAAVADFRPASTATSKVKKDEGVPTIELIPNPDILADLGRWRGEATTPVLVGFAAETDRVEEHGREKLVRKRADVLVVNDVGAPDAGFAVDTNRVVVLDRDGGRRQLELAPKLEIADRILDAVVQRLRR